MLRVVSYRVVRSGREREDDHPLFGEERYCADGKRHRRFCEFSGYIVKGEKGRKEGRKKAGGRTSACLSCTAVDFGDFVDSSCQVSRLG